MSKAALAAALRRKLPIAWNGTVAQVRADKKDPLSGEGLKIQFKDGGEVNIRADSDQWRLTSVLQPSGLPKGETLDQMIQLLEGLGVSDLEPLRGLSVPLRLVATTPPPTPPVTRLRLQQTGRRPKFSRGPEIT